MQRRLLLRDEFTPGAELVELRRQFYPRLLCRLLPHRRPEAGLWFQPGLRVASCGPAILDIFNLTIFPFRCLDLPSHVSSR